MINLQYLKGLFYYVLLKAAKLSTPSEYLTFNVNDYLKKFYSKFDKKSARFSRYIKCVCCYDTVYLIH